MFQISEIAREKILEVMSGQENPIYALRVAIGGRGPQGFMYQLGFVSEENHKDDDTVIELDGIKVLIDAETLPNITGSTMNYEEDSYQSGFTIDNPNPLWQDPLSMRVQTVLDQSVNPALATHGGFVSLTEVKDNVAYVAMGGGCQGCGMASVTLNDGIIVMIKEAVPEIVDIVDVTNHAMGKNPFYTSADAGQSAVSE
jgi:Fe/S biogenesis protein NfuA